MKNSCATVAAAVLTLAGASAAHAGPTETWGESPGNTWLDPWYTFAGDFNCDHKTDYVTVSGNLAALKLSNGVNSFATSSPVPIDPSWASGSWTFVGDFNGDGCDDIASASATNMYLKTGNTFVATFGFGAVNSTINGNWGGNYQYTKAGDFNGDGIDDIASASAGNVYMKFGQTNGHFAGATWTVSNVWSQGQWTFAGDFNGDGKADIASFSAGNAYMKLSTGSGFTSLDAHARAWS